MNNIKMYYLIRLIAFWLLFFALFRLLFALYHHAAIPGGDFPETGLSFLYGLRLDLSVTCVFVFFPFIMWILHQSFNNKMISQVNKGFNYGLIILVTIFSLGNIKIYEEWGTLLSFRALKYLLYPEDALGFVSLGASLLFLFICILLVIAGIVLYKKIVADFPSPPKNTKKMLIEVFVIPVLLLIGSRGGIQQIPINESSSYYSSIQINNLISTNNIWYLVHSILDANTERNPYTFLDFESAKRNTQNINSIPKEKTQSILKTTRPNIIFIILESWTSDIIERQGGEKGVTPFFDELTKEGLLFSQMYSSGFRTDQGLVSVLSGFPAQPNNSIITTPSKAEKLPSITKELSKQGYQLSFFYGGEIAFANMKSYLFNSGFDNITDKSDFSKHQLNSKWGAHDEFVLKKQLDGLKNAKQPFCSVILTLSSHEPFEVTMPTPFNGSNESEQFKKAVYYSDYCLSNYFESAKKQAWYKNTLFILISDHGHRLPKNRDLNMPEGRRITALITGPALKDSLRGKMMNKICNQNDITSTLLAQMELNRKDFIWSKDIFNSTYKEFAYYSNENVLGWITPKQNLVYTFATGSVAAFQENKPQKLNDTTLTEAKSYLQTLYQQYIDY